MDDITSIDFFNLLTEDNDDFTDLLIRNHSGSVSCAYHMVREVTSNLKTITWDPFNTRSLCLFLYPEHISMLSDMVSALNKRLNDQPFKDDHVTIDLFDKYIVIEIVHTKRKVSMCTKKY